MTSKKRFIAGAKCPTCKESDSLRVWEENNIEMVECVECDYLEQQTSEAVEQSAYPSEQMIGIFKPE
ncbi:YheV family putative zinc ribbon protein [Vibrio hibernica]|uniref:YheV family putative zinc ribbon protein n=1 Tax=Vibrio hibernica TaxID=2587465 RepID=UPI00187E834F|nr:YheV family putative zinc ribbon protein [Vibrio hibernica]